MFAIEKISIRTKFAAVGRQIPRTRITRPLRVRLGRRFSLIALSALAIAAGQGVAAESAYATSYDTAGGGICSFVGSQMTLQTGTFRFDAATTTLVKEWTRLVDDNGRAQTGWYYVGSAWAAPGYPAYFGRSSWSRSRWNTSSRIQAYFTFSVNGAVHDDRYVTTTWYYTQVYFSGLGWQPQGWVSSCYH